METCRTSQLDSGSFSESMSCRSGGFLRRRWGVAHRLHPPERQRIPSSASSSSALSSAETQQVLTVHICFVIILFSILFSKSWIFVPCYLQRNLRSFLTLLTIKINLMFGFLNYCDINSSRSFFHAVQSPSCSYLLLQLIQLRGQRRHHLHRHLQFVL